MTIPSILVLLGSVLLLRDPFLFLMVLLNVRREGTTYRSKLMRAATRKTESQKQCLEKILCSVYGSTEIKTEWMSLRDKSFRYRWETPVLLFNYKTTKDVFSREKRQMYNINQNAFLHETSY